MPPIETFHRHQTAVLWAANGTDNNGRRTVAAPVEIKVRWEDGAIESILPDGDPVLLDANVVVAQEVPMGSIMRKGTLASVPTPPTNLMEVNQRRYTPDLKDRKTRRVLMLIRFKDKLPTIV